MPRVSKKACKEVEALLRARLFAADTVIDCGGLDLQPVEGEGGTVDHDETSGGVVLYFKGARAVCTVTVIPDDRERR